MTLTPSQVLLEARSYVERGWCQGAQARNGIGERVAVNSPRARRWCADGALILAASNAEPGALDAARLELVKAIAIPELLARYDNPQVIVMIWNDLQSTTLDGVLQALGRAAGAAVIREL